jgi:hypothetical protein
MVMRTIVQAESDDVVRTQCAWVLQWIVNDPLDVLETTRFICFVKFVGILEDE